MARRAILVEVHDDGCIARRVYQTFFSILPMNAHIKIKNAFRNMLVNDFSEQIYNTNLMIRDEGLEIQGSKNEGD